MKRLTERNPNWINDELWGAACEPDCEEQDEVYRRLNTYENVLFSTDGKEICTVERLTELVKAEQKRREGCEFCNSSICNNCSSICWNGKPEPCNRYEPKHDFCPHCGRDLRGESQND